MLLEKAEVSQLVAYVFSIFCYN